MRIEEWITVRVTKSYNHVGRYMGLSIQSLKDLVKSCMHCVANHMSNFQGSSTHLR